MPFNATFAEVFLGGGGQSRDLKPVFIAARFMSARRHT